MVTADAYTDSNLTDADMVFFKICQRTASECSGEERNLCPCCKHMIGNGALRIFCCQKSKLKTQAKRLCFLSKNVICSLCSKPSLMPKN